MTEAFIVVYQEEKYAESINIKVFTSENAAKSFIKGMNELPDEILGDNGEFYSNDNKYDPDYLHIDICELGD